MFLILIIGLLPLLIPGNIDKFTVISQNETKIDEENLSQDNLFEPKTQDDSQSSKIQFNSSEIINRNYSWVGPTNETLSFETPVEYDTFSADIDFQLSSEIDVDVVVDDITSSPSRVEQAQVFYITKNVSLTSISIFVDNKKPIQIDMEIRNNSIEGDPLHSFSPQIDPFLSPDDYWYEIPITPYLFLEPGKYFLWMDENTYGSPDSSWLKSGVNNTETWQFIGTAWEIAEDFDLTLKIHTSTQYNPEDVEMKVNDVPVINTVSGQGSVKILDVISSFNTTLTVSSNKSISFSYMIESAFIKSETLPYNYEFIEGHYKWNLTLNSSHLEPPYFGYSANISGFRDDYYDIQAFNQTNVIAYTYSLISSEVIEFITEATHIIFKSQNYVESVIVNDNLYSGDITTINVSAKGIGDIYVSIWDDETQIYQNSSYNVSNQIFLWYVDPDLDSNSLSVEIFFNGSNQIGYYSKIIDISRVSEIISSQIDVYALDNFSVSCQYWDPYNEILLSDGIIAYNFGELSGVMEMDIHGNYSNSIDLSQFGILPGEYSISLTAEKENYGLIYYEIPIIINPRPVTIELSKSSTTITPRNTMDFEINLKDIGNEPYLLRPVDIQIKIYYSGNHSVGDLVYNKLLEGINNKEQFSWKVPSNIEEGSYDLVIEVNSDYYTGILNLDGAIEVKSSAFWLISLPILIGLVSSLVGGYFIQKEKVKKSLLGLMILHDNGAPLAEKISYSMKKSDSALVSGAFIGILSLIKEITGSRLRTIEIDGGYVNLINGKSFWLILFIKDNPKWIEKVIVNLRDEIQLEYGKKIIDFHGKPLDISMDDIIKKYFNTKIHTEPPVTED